MDARKDCPKGFDSEVWEKLEKTRSCPSHIEKSERMKHANSCRITVGRTGPCGEEGVRDQLRSQKGVSPDYDEVFTEMHRDKGYSRKAAEKKALKRLKEIDVDVQAIGVWKSKPCDKMVETNISMCPSTSRPGNSEVVEVENEYLKGLLSKIAELQKVVGAI